MRYFFTKHKPKDECAVFGIYNHKDAAKLTMLGLHALQHRGQDATGIVTSDYKNFFAYRGMGHVSDVFSDTRIVGKLKGEISIGYNR